MNQLPTLVEYLLLNHDYVVMPGVGTFIVQQQDARWDAEEEAFLPPYRSVRFNAELTQDDTLLLDSVGAIYRTGRDQAAQMLTTWVADFQQQLEDEGYAEFGAIGDFSREDDGMLLFRPHESGVTTPEFYGLDAYHFSQQAEPRRAKTVPLAASMEADQEAITIRINRNIANIVVAACAAILLFMVFSLPGQDDGRQLRSSLREMLVPTVSLHSSAKAEAPQAQAQEAPKPAAAPTAVPAVGQEGEYCIVLASAVPMKNAREYVGLLTERGFLSARVVESGRMVRVVVGHYPTEEAAQEGARDVRSRSDEYSGAWVMQL